MRTIGRIWVFAKVQPELVSDVEAQKIMQDSFLEFLSPLGDDEFKHIEGKAFFALCRLLSPNFLYFWANRATKAFKATLATHH